VLLQEHLLDVVAAQVSRGLDTAERLYRLELVACSKADAGRSRKRANRLSHGPYWYRYRWYDGKLQKEDVPKSVEFRAIQS